jgi:hypothetical protein
MSIFNQKNAVECSDKNDRMIKSQREFDGLANFRIEEAKWNRNCILPS